MTRLIGVHESVTELFPFELFERAFGRDERSERNGRGSEQTETDVRMVGNDPEALSALDVCVTLAYDESFLEGELRWVHSVQAGVDRFPFEAFREQGIALTSSEGIHGDVVGETVMGYLLAVARGLHRYRDAQRESRWTERDWRRLKTLRGDRVCVVGLGTLGQGVVRRAEAFGMEVVGVKRTPTPVDGVSQVYPSAELEAAIEGSNFVVLCVPLTDGTKGLIGSDELVAMAEDAYLVNVSRGGVIDEQALIEALESGRIAGAALDVFETEPLPRESPLWEMDEVIVTPHIAGAHEEYADRVSELVRENFRRQEAGESLVNRVV